MTSLSRRSSNINQITSHFHSQQPTASPPGSQLKMCQYAYSQFAQCGHRFIEVANFCEKALWRAAISGQLGPCPEIAFRSQLAKAFNPTAAENSIRPEVEKTHLWRGMSGYCRACVSRYKVGTLLPSTKITTS